MNITCHRCARPVVLPDGWLYAGFTCPHCGAATRLVAPGPRQPAGPGVTLVVRALAAAVLALIVFGAGVICGTVGAQMSAPVVVR